MFIKNKNNLNAVFVSVHTYILYILRYNNLVENQITIKKFWGHLKTITTHKFLVTKYCFKCGLIKQGLLHDLSKYSFKEFFPSVKYYQGYRSPIDAQREDVGYSTAWLHHEGRNPHHWEHWIDKDYNNVKLIVLRIPLNYLIESVLDRIAASKVYNKYYTDKAPLDFFEKGKDKMFMGPQNSYRIRMLLEYLAVHGQKKALEYYKDLYEKWKKDNTFDINQ